jgi:FAD/FMN-containing dehydrogenase
VADIVRVCATAGVAIVPQGGNTGLTGAGQPHADMSEVIVSTSRMDRIRAIDPLNDTITVEAGVILKRLQAAAEQADRFFPLSLGAEGSCQIGGNISTNAGGIQVLRYGNMRPW